VDTTLLVRSCVDAGHVPGRPHADAATRTRIPDDDPGVANGGVLRVDGLARRPDALDAEAVLRVDDREVVLQDPVRRLGHIVHDRSDVFPTLLDVTPQTLHLVAKSSEVLTVSGEDLKKLPRRVFQ
jgi:hypothetical protein